MEYQVLARKWRPHSLQEMVGQEHVLRMLTNALEHHRIHHAYLFAGTRGVGKTTLARILAKCLNCEKGISAHPCDTCSACISIDQGKFPDLIEVDAASRTKVEDTRDLLETIQYVPAQGRFKICLIDEVHMLSGHSFNALLKTLEEPPAHVIFLLATTDPHKLPVTVLSRCLQFHLNDVPVSQITERLAFICKAENMPADLSALEQIAIAARGSLRDALSLLDQAIAWCPTAISLDDTRMMLGCVNTDLFFQLLNDIHTQNGEQLLTTIQKITEQAPNIDQLFADLLKLLHQINLQQLFSTQKNSPALQHIATQFSPTDIQLFYQIALIGRRDLAFAPNPQLGFEMAILRMFAFQPECVTEQSPKENITIKTNSPENLSATSMQSFTKAEKQSTNWKHLLSALKLSGMSLALASHCTLKTLNEKTVQLLLAEKHAALLSPKLKERIQEALTAHFQRPIQLSIEFTPESLKSPAIEKAQMQQQRHEQAKDSIQQDIGIQNIMKTFNAKLEDDSIEVI